MRLSHVVARTTDKRRLYTLGAIAASIVGMLVFAGESPKPAAANVRVPSDPNEVVAELLATKAASANERDGGGAAAAESAEQAALDPRQDEIKALRRRLQTQPLDVRAAVRLARLDIELARERSDPRYLGQAQAVLAPWTDDIAPAEVLLLRATIEQSLHDFEAALGHLDRALLLDPNDPQTWLTRAVVLTVRGRYEDARENCGHVAGVDEIPMTVCTTQIDSLTGNARRAYDQLSAAYARVNGAGGMSKSEADWVESSLGEYAWRFGDAPLAEKHFRSALVFAPTDSYARAALADLLIDGGRFKEAADLVAGREVDDGMLLRLAIAERRGGMKDAEEHAKMLRDRFEASRARGDVVHRREESRFWLEVAPDADAAAKALELAKSNWDVQKEPWDARVFVASAVAAKNPTAAAPIFAWLDRTKLEDPTIAKLRQELAPR